MSNLTSLFLHCINCTVFHSWAQRLQHAVLNNYEVDFCLTEFPSPAPQGYYTKSPVNLYAGVYNWQCTFTHSPVEEYRVKQHCCPSRSGSWSQRVECWVLVFWNSAHMESGQDTGRKDERTPRRKEERERDGSRNMYTYSISRGAHTQYRR